RIDRLEAASVDGIDHLAADVQPVGGLDVDDRRGLGCGRVLEGWHGHVPVRGLDRPRAEAMGSAGPSSRSWVPVAEPVASSSFERNLLPRAATVIVSRG